MKFSLFSSKLLVALTLTFFTLSCEKDEPATAGAETRGDFSVEITDAPADDPDVRAVFVTVSEIRVDGQRVEGFSSTTVEISALTDGVTETLFDGQLAADSYAKLEIVLEDGEDAVNGGPGCYVLTEDNTKVALEAAGDGVLTIDNSSFTVTESAGVEAVIDFDLRKALVRAEDQSKPYRFAAESRLENSVRFVQRSNSGKISGKVSGTSESSNGKTVIYAYAKGTYEESEATGDRDDALFLNAVSSTTVDNNTMEYELNFLAEGSYELIPAHYQDDDQDGKVSLNANTKTTTGLNIDLMGVEVDAASSTTVDFKFDILL